MRLGVPPLGVVGAGQVRRTAEELRQARRQGIQAELRRLARRQGLGFRLGAFRQRYQILRPALGKAPGHAPLEFIGQGRMRHPVGIEAVLPLGLVLGTARRLVPLPVDGVGNLERWMRPVQGLARRRHLVLAQGRAMHRRGALLVGRPEADDGLDANQGRTAIGQHRVAQGRLDVVRIVPVHAADHAPAVALEAGRDVLGEPSAHLAVDGDAVVIIEADQLAQPQGAGQGGRFVGDALHQAAVAHHHPSAVIHHIEAKPIELRRQPRLRQRHAHGIGEALAQRPGGGLDAGALAVLRMPGGLGMQLAKGLEVVHRHRIAAQVQQAVQQHGAVPIGEHEPVPVPPAGVLGVVAQHVAPQRLRDIGQPHRRAGVAGTGFLNGIHGQGADGIGPFGA